MWNMFVPRYAHEITPVQKNKSLESIMTTKDNRICDIKGNELSGRCKYIERKLQTSKLNITW